MRIEGIVVLVLEPGLIFLDGLWDMESKDRRVRQGYIVIAIIVSLEICDNRNVCLSLICSFFMFFFVRWIHIQ